MGSRAYHFNKDGKTPDGREIEFFLNENNLLATAGTGTYHLGGIVGGPGRLGPLPTGASYTLDPSGNIILKLP